MPENWPNFFVAGAPKSGTTSLYHYLNQHPEIFMSSVKEPHYFADEVRPCYFGEELRRFSVRGEFPRLVQTESQYLNLFADAGGSAAVGEASVCYLWSASAPRNIANVVPAARIILVLRNPVERAFAQHRKLMHIHPVPLSFAAHIELGLSAHGPELNPAHPFLELGNYHRQMLRYLEYFPSEQIQVHLYDDYRADPAGMLRRIFAFLRVDPDYQPDLSTRHMTGGVPRSLKLHDIAVRKLRLGYRLKKILPDSAHSTLKKLIYRPGKSALIDPRDRARLVDYYRNDVLALSDLLKRDLSHWLQA